MQRLIALLLMAAALTGCAAMRQLDSDVSTYSQWPADRKPGTYAYERLPSQQAEPERQQQLEDAARHALEAAGFTPAPDAASADYLVQLGVRVTGTERGYYEDPFWWHSRMFYGPRGHVFWGGPRFGLGLGYSTPVYEREVAVLVRDRKTGQPLYEARASNSGGSSAIASLLPAMFDAALKDFPQAAVNPRRVRTEIAPS